MRTRFGAYTAVPTTLPSSRSSGMKIHAGRPARAAWAATALARLPVDAQPTVSSPKAAAALIAAATTRSLNERVGCDTASFFTQTRATPSERRQAGHFDQRREAGVEREDGTCPRTAATRGSATATAARAAIRRASAGDGRHRRGARAVPGTLHRSRPVPHRARRRNCGTGAEAHGPAEKRQLRSCRASLSPDYRRRKKAPAATRRGRLAF